MKTISELIKKTNISEGLVRAVIHQVGGWDCFKMLAPVVIVKGVDQNWAGFEFHTETAKFFATYRDLIRKLAHDTAEEGGQSTMQMITKLRYLNGNFNEDEIGVALYGPKSKIDIQIANALAWFTFEKVVQAYSYAITN